MKTATKLTTGVLTIAIMAGGVWAQNNDAIDQARSTAKALQQKQASDTQTTAKPAPGAPAPAVKPAVIPSAKPASSAVATPSKPVPASAENKLQRVNVLPNGDSIQIEINSSGAVTPRVSKLSSPARVVVELPATVIAGSQ